MSSDVPFLPQVLVSEVATLQKPFSGLVFDSFGFDLSYIGCDGTAPDASGWSRTEEGGQTTFTRANPASYLAPVEVMDSFVASSDQASVVIRMGWDAAIAKSTADLGLPVRLSSSSASVQAVIYLVVDNAGTDEVWTYTMQDQSLVRTFVLTGRCYQIVGLTSSTFLYLEEVGVGDYSWRFYTGAGSVTLAAPLDSVSEPDWSTVSDETGLIVYLLNYGTSSTDKLFQISTSGILVQTAIAGPASTTTTMTPSGDYVYFTNTSFDQVHALEISTGALTTTACIPPTDTSSYAVICALSGLLFFLGDSDVWFYQADNAVAGTVAEWQAIAGSFDRGEFTDFPQVFATGSSTMIMNAIGSGGVYSIIRGSFVGNSLVLSEFGTMPTTFSNDSEYASMSMNNGRVTFCNQFNYGIYGGVAQGTRIATDPVAPASEGDNTMLIIGVVIAILVVIGIVLAVLKYRYGLI